MSSNPSFCQVAWYGRDMRDDQRRQRLTDANPWWRAVAGGQGSTVWTEHHPVLKGRGAHDLGFRADVLHDVQSGPVTDQLAVLTGPRRIGKSVALLDTAAALCARRDIDARQVIYLPCDGMGAQDVHRCLVLGRELTRSVDRDQPHPRVWLLDEISGVPGWTSVLKLARDNTAFGGDTVIATGSRSAADEDIEGNLLAGRAGTGAGRRTRLLLPMTFRDYLTASRPELARPAPVYVSDLQTRREVRTRHPRHQVSPGHHRNYLGSASPPAGTSASVSTRGRPAR